MSHSLEYDAPSKIVGTEVDGRIVLAPESSITYENGSEIEKCIQDAIERNKTDIILDCRHVGFLDSAALEVLVQAHTELISGGGTLKIIGLNEVCRDILLATRLITLFFVYKDMHEAMTHNP